jgi:hypothetical protein
VTGQRSNQLNYVPTLFSEARVFTGFPQVEPIRLHQPHRTKF